jgi:putative transposase
MRGTLALHFRAGRNRIGLAGSFLLLDVLLDDLQWCAAAGRGEVRRGPQVTVHEVPADTADEAATLVSAQAFEMRVTSKQALQRLVYGDLKAMGLSAQPAIHVSRKVCGAYAALRADIKAGNLGKPGSRRRVAAGSKPVVFRPDAAQPFDDRCLSWQLDRRTVSIWTTAGRLAGIRFACSGTQPARLREYRQGESDLVHRDGKWFLYATCDIPGPALAGPAGFLGVDLGSRTSPPPMMA